MKLEEMKCFVEVVNARSINQAAKTLFITQPALSRMLTAFETELGFPLLERSKHGIQPTKAGLEVYAGCVKLLQLYEEHRRRWQNLAYETIETPVTVCIVALPMVYNTVMNQISLNIAQQYPRIQLHLFEHRLQNVLPETVTMPHAIGFSHYNEKTKNEIYGFAKAQHMQIIPLFDDEYKFYASHTNPLVGQKLTMANFHDYTLADYSGPDIKNIPEFVEAGMTGLQDQFKQLLHLSNRYTMMETAATSQTVILAADLMTQDNLYRKNGTLLPLDVTDFHLPMTYFLMMAADASVEEKIVADLLKDSYLDFAAQRP